ncbi:MAG: tetratricopeptide repeat protein, partial [Pseudomonadota bacterium]
MKVLADSKEFDAMEILSAEVVRDLGSDDPTRIYCELTRASALNARGRPAEALALLESAYPRCRSYAELHCFVASAMVTALRKLGRFDESLRFAEEVKDLARDVHSPAHICYHESLATYATVLGDTG